MRALRMLVRKMRGPVPTSEGPKHRAWLACAALGGALALVLWGCLNPRPDEDPSVSDPDLNEVPNASSGQEFCDTNPLAQDCEGSGGMVTAPDDIDIGPDPNEAGPGVDAGARDAGAPDASPNANK